MKVNQTNIEPKPSLGLDLIDPQSSYYHCVQGPAAGGQHRRHGQAALSGGQAPGQAGQL